MKDLVGVGVADRGQEARIGQRALDRVALARQRLRNSARVDPGTSRPPRSKAPRRRASGDEMQGSAALRPGLGQHERSLREVERARPDRRPTGRAARLPVEASRDHQMEDEEEVALEREDEPFPMRSRPATRRPDASASGGATERSTNGFPRRTASRVRPTTRGSSAVMYASRSGSSGTRGAYRQCRAGGIARRRRCREAPGRSARGRCGARPEIGERTDRLAEEEFGVPANEIVAERSHHSVAELFVQPPRLVVEGRHAQEDVRRLAEDPLLGELDEARPDAAAAELGRDAHRLDVTDERAAHAQDDKAAQDGSMPRHVALARLVAHPAERLGEIPPERDPGLGGRHETGAPLRFGVRSEGLDR